MTGSNVAPAIPGGRADGTEWLRPADQPVGLSRYLDVLRERRLFVVGAILLALASAILYLAVANKVYEAEADLLVTPIPGGELPITLPVIRESSDPTRDVETVARLVTTRDVAERAAAQLDDRVTVEKMLESVTAEPVAQSNIVSIVAEAGSAELARDVANAAGKALLKERNEQLNAALDPSIERLRATVAASPPGTAVGLDTPQDQLEQLEALKSSGDPSLRLETRAVAPDSPASPKALLTVIAALIGGLIVGLAGAFGLHAIDPRLRREEQLRELFRIPILARIPKQARTGEQRSGLGFGRGKDYRRPLGPTELSPATVEAYRTLRGMLAASRSQGSDGRSVLVTGSSPSEGKTTTAVNLATSLAMAGEPVILLESDLRRPTIGETLGVAPRFGFGAVLLGGLPLEDALLPVEPFGPLLRVLLADRTSESMPSEMLALPAASTLLDDASRLADHVIIDSPPLTEVIDALPLARHADDLIVVVRLGATRLTQLNRLGDLLAQNAIRPTGVVLVGAGNADRPSYYLQAGRDRLWSAEPQEDEEETRSTWAR